MAVVSRRQPSALVSNGLAAATVALNIAGAATDAVPIAKQILNSAAHISAVAEKIQKKREAMYTLVEKADIYATQINIAVAGRILDASLQRRLERLYFVVLKIEALVEAKVGSKKNALTRAWRNVVTKPNRAERLVVELEREVQLFQLLTGIQLSLVADNTARAVDNTARAVAADVRYDDQLRLLRDCDIDKREIIERRGTDEGTVVWASARVDGQLFVIRYLESQSNAETNTMTTLNGSSHPWGAKYYEYLENVKKVSTVRGSHPNIVQLYGRHFQGPEAVFRAGTLDLLDYLEKLQPREGNEEDIALKQLTLAYKMLDASAHLEDIHGLRWVGGAAIIDENGEPRIGLFDDIVRPDPDHPLFRLPPIYSYMFTWINSSYSEETGVVEQAHDSSLHAIMTEQLRDGNETDRLQRLWDIIREEKFRVCCYTRKFPIISGNFSLSEELIARARLYFETNTKDDDPYCNCKSSFVRHVLAGGGANTSSEMCVWMRRHDDEYIIHVEACTHHNTHIQYHHFIIRIPAGYPLLAAVARAAGLPDDFQHSGNGSDWIIYPQFSSWDEGDSDAWDSSGDEEDEEYETAEEGETSSDDAGQE
ncbi:hypothetical protein EXIGLDRAFT_727585 [Exidia glandulosa HHB12029]|uniref:Protein kinase domain-containing protein n=1 Tax=Exidia glandulosa HHB12029 TaxID=1314781 RepID=A0A165DAX7_EXIGL|nr:hypothetical protein EXIGLDRAFT_727585 [Exidia glandulosa HHB12029]